MTVSEIQSDVESDRLSPEAIYTMAILFFTLLFSFIDRQIVSILVQPIKADIHLSDTQIGLLNGAAFSVLYIVASFPLARVADRGNRRTLIALCLGAWSVMTMLAGVAQNFFQLAFARMGVAIGEAGGQPASYSMAHDLVGPNRIVFAVGFLNCAAAVGLGFGILLAGWLNDMVGWRGAFFVVGAPGLLFALLLRFGVREPRRIGASDLPARVGFRAALGYFWLIKSFRTLVWVPAFAAVTSYAILAWLPAFFMRVNGFSTTKVGVGVGMATMIAMAPGALLAGLLSDRLRRHGMHWQMRLAGLATFCSIPPILVALFTHDFTVAIVAYGVYAFFAVFQQPIAFATGVQLARADMRASAASVITIATNLFGLTLGPLLVGGLNDYLHAAYGAGAIRYSICVCLIGLPLSAFMAILTARRLRKAEAVAA